MALDPEMVAVLDKYFRETQKVVKEEVRILREETVQRFAGMEKAIQRNSEETRHLGVRIEGLESTIQTVAEGVVGNNERLDAFRGEVAQEFKEVRATMQVHYRELDRRITRLEQKAEVKVAVKKASRGN